MPDLIQQLERLRQLLEGAVQQQERGKASRDAEFVVWHDRLLSTLTSLFGKDSRQTKRIADLTFTYRRKIRIAGVDYSDVDREVRQTRFKRDLTITIGLLTNYMDELRLEHQQVHTMPAGSTATHPLAQLHPIVQRVATKLFQDGHYREAILNTYIALDNAVRDKAQLPPTAHGTKLMEQAFAPANPILRITTSADEQQGFMTLFRGAMLAIRNPKAHSLGGTADPQRALEWLSFASVLLRNLDEAEVVQTQANMP
ncbi:TIGR02391 family protein [Hymenobacter defluvii]|uniref:TIGR02391 family protein n=1 Tax=Hymenobacter defluvii TaxID=2054411 RepID=A0ABS3TI63_9BACT|nr:TIGR02391 family protein [Hymenobacter defluvii]MBO3272385.1 TIGR02391 family protein [Hymenobacter defluvii]